VRMSVWKTEENSALAAFSLSSFPSTPLSSLFTARRTSLFVSTKSPIIPTSTYLGVEGGREEGREGGREGSICVFVCQGERHTGSDVRSRRACKHTRKRGEDLLEHGVVVQNDGHHA